MSKEQQGISPINKKGQEIQSRRKELLKQKEEIAKERLDLQKMAEDIFSLAEEIKLNKQEILEPQIADNSKTTKVSFSKNADFDPVAYEKEQKLIDIERGNEIEKMVKEISLEGEDEETNEYESYSDYLKKKNKIKKKEANEEAGAIIDAIFQKIEEKRKKTLEFRNNLERSKNLDFSQEPENKGEEEETENVEEGIKGGVEEEKKSLVEVEKKVEATREKYIKEYKKCRKESDKQALIDKTKKETFNILAGVTNLLRKDKFKYIEKVVRPEDYFTEETKKAKTEYDEARKEMGDEMFNKKKAELEKAGLSGEELEKALANYRGIEIIAKTITEEGQKVIDAKAEKPILLKRILTGYMALKPRWKRVALSTLIFLPFSATGALGASAIAAGGIFAGIAGLAGVKFAASMAIGYGVGHLSHGIDLVKKKSDLEFGKNQDNKKLEFKDKFSKGEIGLEEYEKEIDVIGKEERKRARDRMILKAGVGGAMALIAGFVAYDAMGNGLGHIEEASSTGNINIPAIQTEAIAQQTLPEVVVTPESHAEVIATADHGQGAISTLRELQNNLKTEYPDINNVPENVKHILNTDADELAKEFKMYQPGQEAESALIKAGSYFKVDGSGDVTFHDSGTTEGIQIMGKSYSGQMIDSDHLGTQVSEGVETTDHPVGTENLSGSEEVGSDFLKNNPQSSPLETGINPENLPKEFQEPLNNELTGEVKTSQDYNEEETRGGMTDQDNEIQKPTDHHEFSPRELKQINKVYEHNINHVFPDEKGLKLWDEIKGWDAEKLFHQDIEKLKPEFRELFTHFHQLSEVTGLEPIRETLIHPAETNAEFIDRALEKATILGKLKEVKL